MNLSLPPELLLFTLFFLLGDDGVGEADNVLALLLGVLFELDNLDSI